MADDAADKVEAKVRKWWNRWTLLAAIVLAFTSGGVTATLMFAAEWVDMNSRPGDVMDATDLAPEMIPLIHENQDEIDDLWHFVCRHHPEECEQ